MDPGWPANPAQSVVCLLCSAALPHQPETFFRHLVQEHSAFHNLNLLLELSLAQPTGTLLPPSPHPEVLEVQSFGPQHGAQEVEVPDHGGEVEVALQEMVPGDPGMDIQLTFLEDSRPRQLLIPLPPSPPEDWALLDPISIVPGLGSAGHALPAPPPGPRTREAIIPRRRLANRTIRPPGLPAIPTRSLGPLGGFQQLIEANPNRNLVPEDLQQLIVDSNPARRLGFTHSQRLNTQMVLDDFVLKKKRGPSWSAGGERTVGWRCVEPSCPYTCTTMEGALAEGRRPHGHPARPGLAAKREAYARVKGRAPGEQGAGAVSSIVNEVVGDIQPSERGSLGIDAIKQAARRFTRKLRQSEGRREGTMAIPAIPGLHPDSQEVTIVEWMEDGGIVMVEEENQLAEIQEVSIYDEIQGEVLEEEKHDEVFFKDGVGNEEEMQDDNVVNKLEKQEPDPDVIEQKKAKKVVQPEQEMIELNIYPKEVKDEFHQTKLIDECIDRVINFFETEDLKEPKEETDSLVEIVENSEKSVKKQGNVMNNKLMYIQEPMKNVVNQVKIQEAEAPRRKSLRHTKHLFM